MRNFLVLFIIIINNCLNVSSQDMGPSDDLSSETIKKLSLKNYCEVTEFYNPSGTKYSEDTLLKRMYNRNGQLICIWRYTLDIVDMLDSSAFVYDTTGKLLSRTRYTIYDPKHESTEDEKSDLPPFTSVTTKYVYDKNDRLYYSTFPNDWEDEKLDTTWYKYDKNGNLISKIKGNEKVTYEYKKGKLVNENEDITQLDLGLIKVMPRSKSIQYSYDSKERMSLILEFRNNNGKEAEVKTEYIYNDKNQIIEMKKYLNGKFNYHEKYTYNDEGLLSTSTYLDKISGEMKMRDVRRYEFYK
jgi:hypothetical protein